MRDHLRRYRAIRAAFTPGYPSEPPGHMASQVTTRAALRSGLVARKSPPRPTMATPGPDGTTPARRVQRVARGVGTDDSGEAGDFCPSADVLRAPVAWPPLGLVSAGRVVGRGGLALLSPVGYQGRARPLAGRVRHGQKGPFAADRPLALGEQGHEVLPPGTPGRLVGAGACAGPGLPQPLAEAAWASVGRTGGNLTASWAGEPVRLAAWRGWRTPGPRVDVPAVVFTAAADGPVRRRWWWAPGDQAPLSVGTKMAAAEAAGRWEAKRVRLAPCFSDQHSRGVPLPQAPLAHPKRRSRLGIAACFASLWIVSLGSVCVTAGWGKSSHRRGRGDVRLCQLGWRLLEHFLTDDRSIPVAFHVVLEGSKSVR